MKPFNSLRKRIVTAYLLFSLSCSLFFAAATIAVVEGIEARQDDRLQEVAAWASARHASKQPLEMPTVMSFYQGHSIPPALRNIPPGIQEITVNGTDLHVFAGQNAVSPFIVIDHESDYEKVEVAVFSLLGIGLLGFIAMSLLLGGYMARRFVTPIISLSTAVAERRKDLPLQNNNDELGVLARAFAGHTSELQQFLDRERFFTGDVSHELRTPLTVISGAAELLMIESVDKPAIYAPAERIYRAVHDASESVAILLLLARSPDLIEADTISLAEIAQEEVARYQTLLSNKPVVLGYGGGVDFTIRAPRKLVSAAIGNLIRNACQYTGQGSVNVLLEQNAVVVKDTGHSIPDAVRAMLNKDSCAIQFRGSAGTGLGLALVKRICEYLGATLSVADLSVDGNIFKIHFTNDLTES